MSAYERAVSAALTLPDAEVYVEALAAGAGWQWPGSLFAPKITGVYGDGDCCPLGAALLAAGVDRDRTGSGFPDPEDEPMLAVILFTLGGTAEGWRRIVREVDG